MADDDGDDIGAVRNSRAAQDASQAMVNTDVFSCEISLLLLLGSCLSYVGEFFRKA